MPSNESTTLRTSTQIFEECLAAGERYREIRDLPESRRGDNWEAERRQAAQELIELNAELDLALRMERYAVERAAWEQAIADAQRSDRHDQIRGPMAAFAPLGGGEVRSAGAQVVESEQYREMRNARGFPEVEVRNLLTAGDSGVGSHLFVPVGQPFLPPQGVQRRRLFVTDLITVQPTGLQSVPYIREQDALLLEGGASAVAEASAKPEVDTRFSRDDAPVRKIAAWIQVTQEAVDDAPTLRGYIDGRLGYMLEIERERQLLAGGGVAPNLKGITDYAIQQNTGLFYQGVGTSIGKIEAADGDADAVVANPLDFWAAVTDRHQDGFDGSAFGSAPFGPPLPTAWGLPVIRSRALTPGTALVGAFRLGATMFEREGITIRSTDSHASLFISNTLVVLAELRCALAVHRPDWFVALTVTPPS